MSSWGKVFQAGDKVTMVSDASLKWLGEAGLTQDCKMSFKQQLI